MIAPDRETFRSLAREGNLIALTRRLMSDQLTPVLAYRRLVLPDERTAPSFLFESVEGGTFIGRYSFLGAQPIVEVIAEGHEVTIEDHRDDSRTKSHEANPLSVPARLTQQWKPVDPAHRRRGGSLPGFTGGWVGYAGYDTVRYLEPEKLAFEDAPRDDRSLPDMHFGLYRDVVVFDHVSKTLSVVHHVHVDEHISVDAAYEAGCASLDAFVARVESDAIPLRAGDVDLDLAGRSRAEISSNFKRADFEQAVRTAKEYIAAGDAFQIVISQRFERQTSADPFDIYRALRIVNPSPYMIYLQARGSILVASSPEILCRVEDDLVTSRPLAGTRHRGRSEEEDAVLEEDLRGSEKDVAEHVMLVDLGRNDLGRVCEIGSINLERVMDVERYSHVMHLSSTVTGHLRQGLTAWDALANTLPVGTVSGAPKVRAMQIIDELEPTRRGPYAGGIGCVGFTGDMDIALALRTMVIPTSASSSPAQGWAVHLQAGAGIVADSDPAAEYEETVNKAAALARAIDLAEHTMGESSAKSAQ
ncbi:MAG: anthranilate synthase component I [Phycisphaerales bacterium]|nr:MAG: anthranilate synthase component I [Phycisphaerales bacterium]